MKSYTDLQTFCQTLSNDSSTGTLTLFNELINDGVRKALGSFAWPFLEKTVTIATVAGQQFYNLPYDFGQTNSVTITVGTTRYNIDQAATRQFWDAINVSPVTSNVPQFFFPFNRQIGIFPTPSSSGNTITIIYKRAVKDLSIADVTDTIGSVNLGGLTVIGTGGNFTTPMVGRFIRITDSNTGNNGDGFWYEIGAVSSTTNLTLVAPYGGTTISGGSAACVIGQMSILPENYQQLPAYYALAQYWNSVQSDQNKNAAYLAMWQDGVKEMMTEFGATSTNVDVTIQDISDINANLYLRY